MMINKQTATRDQTRSAAVVVKALPNMSGDIRKRRAQTATMENIVMNGGWQTANLVDLAHTRHSQILVMDTHLVLRAVQANTSRSGELPLVLRAVQANTSQRRELPLAGLQRRTQQLRSQPRLPL